MATDLVMYEAALLHAADDTIAGYLTSLQGDLYQSPIDVDMNTPLSAFTSAVANYDGYAQKTVTWQAPSISDDGHVEVIGAFSSWRMTTENVDNSIFGIYLTGNVDNDLLFAAAFDPGPLPMESNMDQILTTIRYRPGPPSSIEIIS